MKLGSGLDYGNLRRIAVGEAALQANARALATLAERLGRGLPKTTRRKELPE